MGERDIVCRQAGPDDLDSIFHLYSRYMFDSYLLKFGSAFVKEYLKVILGSKNCIAQIALDRKAVGFIIAAFDTNSLRTELLFHSKILLKWIKQTLTRPHPQRAFVSLGLLAYSLHTGLKGIHAELLFIAVDPSYRHRGLATTLVEEVLRAIQLHGIIKVKVSTHANNESVNALLAKLGFKMRRTFRLFMKPMNLYVLELTPRLKRCIY